jgi:hypothetical protein
LGHRITYSDKVECKFFHFFSYYTKERLIVQKKEQNENQPRQRKNTKQDDNQTQDKSSSESLTSALSHNACGTCSINYWSIGIFLLGLICICVYTYIYKEMNFDSLVFVIILNTILLIVLYLIRISWYTWNKLSDEKLLSFILQNPYKLIGIPCLIVILLAFVVYHGKTEILISSLVNKTFTWLDIKQYEDI